MSKLYLAYLHESHIRLFEPTINVTWNIKFQISFVVTSIKKEIIRFKAYGLHRIILTLIDIKST